MKEATTNLIQAGRKNILTIYRQKFPLWKNGGRAPVLSIFAAIPSLPSDRSFQLEDVTSQPTYLLSCKPSICHRTFLLITSGLHGSLKRMKFKAHRVHYTPQQRYLQTVTFPTKVMATALPQELEGET